MDLRRDRSAYTVSHAPFCRRGLPEAFSRQQRWYFTFYVNDSAHHLTPARIADDVDFACMISHSKFSELGMRNHASENQHD